MLYPLLVVSLMSSSASSVTMMYHQRATTTFWPLALLTLCAFRVMRGGYAQPQQMYVPLAFTLMLSALGVIGDSDGRREDNLAFLTPLTTLYLLVAIWPKVQEFVLKLNFILVYIAPWQISWGSAFHAFAQPFSVPHTGVICAQATISSILSAPLNPFLGTLTNSHLLGCPKIPLV